MPPWSRDHGVDVHAELLGRGARRNNPQFQTGMITLEFGKARDQPAHRESRQGRYPQHPRGRCGIAQTLRHSCQSIERRTDLGEQIRPRLGRRCVAAGAQKQPGAKPILEQSKAADLIASIQDLRLGTRLQIDNSVTWPFLSILVSWTALLFFGFGLLARLNAAAVFTLAIGALSVASAIFLILELDAPYSGILRLPPTPILDAIDALGK